MTDGPEQAPAEILARKMCVRDGGDPDALCSRYQLARAPVQGAYMIPSPEMCQPLWTLYLAYAQAALEAD